MDHSSPWSDSKMFGKIAHNLTKIRKSIKRIFKRKKGQSDTEGSSIEISKSHNVTHRSVSVNPSGISKQKTSVTTRMSLPVLTKNTQDLVSFDTTNHLKDYNQGHSKISWTTQTNYKKHQKRRKKSTNFQSIRHQTHHELCYSNHVSFLPNPHSRNLSQFNPTIPNHYTTNPEKVL